ncbi:uncharacterized protein LOC143442062 isoform X5 [Arvicanthis niloticus]|uniref:uncharacterized protein LOC143312284 isoform X1 n=1 Tax=Arvicanthis niloticus TaxID=61156 RepID=UPI00402B78E5
MQVLEIEPGPLERSWRSLLFSYVFSSGLLHSWNVSPCSGPSPPADLCNFSLRSSDALFWLLQNVSWAFNNEHHRWKQDGYLLWSLCCQFSYWRAFARGRGKISLDFTCRNTHVIGTPSEQVGRCCCQTICITAILRSHIWNGSQSGRLDRLGLLKYKLVSRVDKMAQQVKKLADERHLSSLPRTHTMEGEMDGGSPCRLSSDLHMCTEGSTRHHPKLINTGTGSPSH